MTRIIFISLITGLMCNCTIPQPMNPLQGTWKMVYAETLENDTIKIKDFSNTEFIKIINSNHFAFFNQEIGSTHNFYGGAGTYILDGSSYTETLSYTSVEAIKNHKFSFNVEFKGDTLIQSGIEKIAKAGIDRKITEKYIKIKE